MYPPPLAQLLALFHPIGWPLFIVGWTTLLFTCIGYLLGRWAFVGIGAGVAALATPFGVSWVLGPALVGNVTLVMAAAIVLGMRHPAVWAVPLVTKMTVGVGVLWFAFRGEWRSFAIAIGATLVVVVLSALVAPDAWLAFTRFALANVGATENGVPIVGPPLWVRLPIAVIVVAWGARTDRPWAVPIACGLALAGLYGLGSIVTIAAGLGGACSLERSARADRERRPRFASNAPRSVATVGAQVANS